jgi:hypothetical protein
MGTTIRNFTLTIKLAVYLCDKMLLGIVIANKPILLRAVIFFLKPVKFYKYAFCHEGKFAYLKICPKFQIFYTHIGPFNTKKTLTLFSDFSSFGLQTLISA